MDALAIDDQLVEAAVLGGAVLGGGGGGWPDDGRALGRAAVATGRLRFADVRQLDPAAIVITAAMIGAPGAPERCLEPEHYLRSVELLAREVEAPIGGVISNEIGPMAGLNGWLQAARLGLPFLDAPCNGRAHPLGVMGSLGLHRRADYVTVQTAVGGSRAAGRYVEVVARGAVQATARVIRDASVVAGGLVATARNPVEASWVAAHAAPGALSQAVALGRRMLDAPDGPSAWSRVAAEALGGTLLPELTVSRVDFRSAGGFDTAEIHLEDRGARYLVVACNEYLTLDRSGTRLAEYPELIALFQTGGAPLGSSEVQAGRRVDVLRVPAERLQLGAGGRDPELIRQILDNLGGVISE